MDNRFLDLSALLCGLLLCSALDESSAQNFAEPQSGDMNTHGERNMIKQLRISLEETNLNESGQDEISLSSFASHSGRSNSEKQVLSSKSLKEFLMQWAGDKQLENDERLWLGKYFNRLGAAFFEAYFYITHEEILLIRNAVQNIPVDTPKLHQALTTLSEYEANLLFHAKFKRITLDCRAYINWTAVNETQEAYEDVCRVASCAHESFDFTHALRRCLDAHATNARLLPRREGEPSTKVIVGYEFLLMNVISLRDSGEIVFLGSLNVAWNDVSRTWDANVTGRPPLPALMRIWPHEVWHPAFYIDKCISSNCIIKPDNETIAITYVGILYYSVRMHNQNI